MASSPTVPDFQSSDRNDTQTLDTRQKEIYVINNQRDDFSSQQIMHGRPFYFSNRLSLNQNSQVGLDQYSDIKTPSNDASTGISGLSSTESSISSNSEQYLYIPGTLNKPNIDEGKIRAESEALLRDKFNVNYQRPFKVQSYQTLASLHHTFSPPQRLVSIARAHEFGDSISDDGYLVYPRYDARNDKLDFFSRSDKHTGGAWNDITVPMTEYLGSGILHHLRFSTGLYEGTPFVNPQFLTQSSGSNIHTANEYNNYNNIDRDVLLSDESQYAIRVNDIIDPNINRNRTIMANESSPSPMDYDLTSFDSWWHTPNSLSLLHSVANKNDTNTVEYSGLTPIIVERDVFPVGSGAVTNPTHITTVTSPAGPLFRTYLNSTIQPYYPEKLQGYTDYGQSATLPHTPFPPDLNSHLYFNVGRHGEPFLVPPNTGIFMHWLSGFESFRRLKQYVARKTIAAQTSTSNRMIEQFRSCKNISNSSNTHIHQTNITSISHDLTSDDKGDVQSASSSSPSSTFESFVLPPSPTRLRPTPWAPYSSFFFSQCNTYSTLPVHNHQQIQDIFTVVAAPKGTPTTTVSHDPDLAAIDSKLGLISPNVHSLNLFDSDFIRSIRYTPITSPQLIAKCSQLAYFNQDRFNTTNQILHDNIKSNVSNTSPPCSSSFVLASLPHAGTTTATTQSRQTHSPFMPYYSSVSLSSSPFSSSEKSISSSFKALFNHGSQIFTDMASTLRSTLFEPSQSSLSAIPSVSPSTSCASACSAVPHDSKKSNANTKVLASVYESEWPSIQSGGPTPLPAVIPSSRLPLSPSPALRVSKVKQRKVHHHAASIRHSVSLSLKHKQPRIYTPNIDQAITRPFTFKPLLSSPYPPPPPPPPSSSPTIEPEHTAPLQQSKKPAVVQSTISHSPIIVSGVSLHRLQVLDIINRTLYASAMKKNTPQSSHQLASRVTKRLDTINAVHLKHKHTNTLIQYPCYPRQLPRHIRVAFCLDKPRRIKSRPQRSSLIPRRLRSVHRDPIVTKTKTSINIQLSSSPLSIPASSIDHTPPPTQEYFTHLTYLAIEGIDTSHQYVDNVEYIDSNKILTPALFKEYLEHQKKLRTEALVEQAVANEHGSLVKQQQQQQQKPEQQQQILEPGMVEPHTVIELSPQHQHQSSPSPPTSTASTAAIATVPTNAASVTSTSPSRRNSLSLSLSREAALPYATQRAQYEMEQTQIRYSLNNLQEDVSIEDDNDTTTNNNIIHRSLSHISSSLQSIITPTREYISTLYDPLGLYRNPTPFTYGQCIKSITLTILIPLAIIRLIFIIPLLLLAMLFAWLATIGLNPTVDNEYEMIIPRNRLRRFLSFPLPWIGRALMFFLGHYWLTTKGKLSPHGIAPVMVCNHVSLLDTIIMYFVGHGNVMFIAKAEVSKAPLFGRVAVANGTILVHRGDRTSRQSTQKIANRRIQHTYRLALIKLRDEMIKKYPHDPRSYLPVKDLSDEVQYYSAPGSNNGDHHHHHHHQPPPQQQQQQHGSHYHHNDSNDHIIPYNSNNNNNNNSYYNYHQRLRDLVDLNTVVQEYPPLCIFPEGTTTVGESLIDFKLGPFRSGTPVQPLTIRYPHKYFNPTYAGDKSTLAVIIFIWRLLTQFISYCEVVYHPIYYPSQAEIDNPSLYAENVNKYMAKQLNLPITHLNAY